MGAFSIWHIADPGAVALVLFGGRGKVSDLMGDFGKGINSFKKGLSEDKDDPKVINAEADTNKDKDHRLSGWRGSLPCSTFSAGATSSSCSSSRWSWWGRRICRA